MTEKGGSILPELESRLFSLQMTNSMSGLSMPGTSMRGLSLSGHATENG